MTNSLVTGAMIQELLEDEIGEEQVAARLSAACRFAWALLQSDGLVGDPPFTGNHRSDVEAAAAGAASVDDCDAPHRSQQAIAIIESASRLITTEGGGGAAVFHEAYALGMEVIKAIVMDLGLWGIALRSLDERVRVDEGRRKGHEGRRFWHEEAIRLARERRAAKPDESDAALFDYVRGELVMVFPGRRQPPTSSGIAKHFTGPKGWFATGLVPSRARNLAPSSNS